MKAILLAAALAGSAPDAPAANFSYMAGSRLSDVCSGADSAANDSQCSVYIEGWVAGFLLAESFDANDLHSCLPAMTPAEALPIVRSYMRDHPTETRDQFAARLVWDALYQGHHCVKRGK